MTVFQRVGVTSEGSMDGATTQVSLRAGPGGHVALHDYGFGVSSQWNIQNNGANRASDDRTLSEAPRMEIVIAGREGGLLRDALNSTFDSWDAGERSAETMFLGEAAHGFSAVTALAAEVGGQQMVYAAAQSSTDLTAFQYNGIELSSPASYGRVYLEFISNIAIVETGGYLFTATATATKGGITSYSMSATGAFSALGRLGADDSLPVARLTALDAAHVDTIADSTTTTLDRVSGLEAVAHSTGFNVFNTLASEAGINQFRVDFAPGGIIAKANGMLQGTAGVDILMTGDAEGLRIQARGGDDILIYGADENRLRGVAGADTFGFIKDSEQDWFNDFDAAYDTIDLSDGGGLTVANQQDIKANDNGAWIVFGEEQLGVRTADGPPLTAQQVMNAAAAFMPHVDAVLGPRLVGEGSPPPPAKVTPEQLTGLGTHAGDGSKSAVSWDVNLANYPDPDAQWGGEPEFVNDQELAAASGIIGLTLQGDDGDDLMMGSALNDAIAGGAGNDTITGGAGDDMIAGVDGNDVLRGSDGNDSIGGGLGNDTIEGGVGDDQIGGGRGNDVISGQDGNDVLSGGAGNDWLRGGEGDNMLAGGFGNDTVQGEGGDDNMGGGTGKDRIIGGEGNDSMGGGEGDDMLMGGAGNDFVAGGGRHDTLDGGGGIDRLNGGAGNDVMTGGSGGDTFIFNEMTEAESDVITDFQVGVDTLRLQGIAGANQSARFNNLDITQDGQAVEIHYDGHIIRLEGVQVNQLDQSDFLLS